ncbi:MAG: DUF1640 domain-containing protein [Boseongicola sp. SB0673_bin_14]|nr:DUF1640 domain-containing protein [Boseongicola sp. SB0673_bin_14]
MLPSWHGRRFLRHTGHDAAAQGQGLPSDQAEAITEAVRAGVTGGVATKADLAELRGEMSARFAQIESDLLWMKRIGGVIIALLAVPILRDLLSALN